MGQRYVGCRVRRSTAHSSARLKSSSHQTPRQLANDVSPLVQGSQAPSPVMRVPPYETTSNSRPPTEGKAKAATARSVTPEVATLPTHAPWWFSSTHSNGGPS